ncbi:TonB-dependent receptor family protein [Deminuibacter soli]|nr:TonB-dependent receptor [Deminuibacter soli]
MRNTIAAIALITLSATAASAQQTPSDTLVNRVMDTVTVNAWLQRTGHFMPGVEGTSIYAGKKTNVVQPDAAQVNLAQNVSRMAFAKIPGLNVWDMDGAGTQANIGSRGTDSHRSIEMNMRQNGYNTNSDMFGYPEDHYTPPMQAIERIELVRGAASLQFGSQFGGMMNYVMKQGDSTRPIAIESEQTVGSNNFFNSYNAIGGTKGKVDYYAYFDNRSGDGWRPNARFNYHAYYANLRYHLGTKGSIALQFSRMDYVQQIAGGQSDAQFYSNSRQSNRTRNFFNPEINIPSLLFKYQFNSNTSIDVTTHALFGQRNSVQFIATPDVSDTINKALGTYNPRQVDRDYYNGFTTEARVLHKYNLGGNTSSLAAGVRYFTELTKRKQKGKGTIGSDFDLSLTSPYAIDLRLHSNNYAVFAENLFQLGKKLSVTPGLRYEVIQTKMTGVINNATYPVSYKGNRSFPLAGVGLQYQVNNSVQLYGNWSQAYRPYIYANVTPATQIDQIDPNLKDSKGYDADFGFRGNYKNVVQFDVNGFYLYYGNRIGLLTQTKNNTTYLLTTNIGNAVSKGVEAFAEVSLAKLFYGRHAGFDVSVFSSFAYTHARYTSGNLSVSGANKSLAGNQLESVPTYINRAGINAQYKQFSTFLQWSYVGKSFSDANNTVYLANGSVGVVPDYHLVDWSASWQFVKICRLSAGINNLTNKAYFTRRITMYPGPGILPADGRTFYVSLGLKL